MKALKEAADRCDTPKQFRNLLQQHLRRLIPYDKFAASWGVPKKHSINYIFQVNLPLDFLGWYLTTGAQWESPIFHDWVQNQRTVPFLWADEAKRLNVAETNPELFRRITEGGLRNSMTGGRASPSHYIALHAVMPSEKDARTYLPIYKQLLPWIVEASQRAYPDSLLTKREKAVLKRRAHGEIVKQISASEGMAERTVRQHLQNIKKKLYTDDLINAVIIASQSGMIPFEK